MMHFFTLGVAIAYQSEICVSVRLLADVLKGHVSPLEEVLVSFVLGKAEEQKCQHAVPFNAFSKKTKSRAVCNMHVDANALTFLSSTTTSVLCLLIVWG